MDQTLYESLFESPQTQEPFVVTEPGKPDYRDFNYLMLVHVDEYNVRGNAMLDQGAAPVPEPGTIIALSLGLAVAARRLKRRKV
jgi:hypothetical protein